MKIIFDGTHVRFEGSKGKPLGQTRAGLPKKRVAWTALIMLKDNDGNAIESPWATPKRHRLNYLEAKATVFAIVEELQKQFMSEYGRAPDSAHFTMVSS